MSQWDGKAKGTPLGYKIFIFCIKNFGLNAAYTVLFFVAGYYIIFSFSTTKTSYYYFRKRLQQSRFTSLVNVYRNYFVFGQTLIDRTAISCGLKNEFTFTYDGRERIQDMINENNGGVIFSAHVGSFNIARYYFFDDLDMKDAIIYLIVTDQENEQIKEYVGATSGETKMKFIVIKEDMSHIFEMNDAMATGGIIIFAADRYVEGVQFIEEDFLGKPVKFPSGPYKLAARKKVPVLFLYIMKGANKAYHLYAKVPNYTETPVRPRHIVKEYVRSLEFIVKKYPLQWFNYYDYWEDLN